MATPTHRGSGELRVGPISDIVSPDAETTAPPPVDATRAMVQSVRDLVRTVLDIDRHDNRHEDGLSAVDQWLRGIMGDEAAA